MNKKKQKIIYVMGAGRSGSTILGIILGDNDSVAHVGEINEFYESYGLPPSRAENSHHFLFYKRIYDDAFKACNIKEVKKTKESESHINYLRLFFSLYKKREKKNYSKINNILFSELFKRMNVDTIIDSSKNPGRALLLKRLCEYDIKLIFLMRRYRDVFSALVNNVNEKTRKRGFFNASIYYLLINAASILTYSIYKEKDRMIINYQKLKNNPISVLLEIQEKFGVNFSVSIDKIEKNKPLKTGLIFAGNRIRMSESTIFEVNK